MAGLSEILQDAIKLEQDGEKYYREAAENVTNPLARSTFIALADQEVKHADLLRAYCDAVSEGGICPTPAEIDAGEYSVASTAANIFAEARKELAAGAIMPEDLSSLYDGAMAMERKSIALYANEAEKAKEAEDREFFEYLVKQEKGHLQILMQGQKYLDDPESWFFEEEQWGVTG